MLTSLRQDLTYAVRSFSHTPGLVAAVVVSIGLGIGANTTVFSLVNELILRDVPVREPSTLFTLAQGKSTTFSFPDHRDFASATQIFEGLAAHCPIVPANMKAGASAERVWGQMVSGNYFSLLGVPLALGRGIAPSEDEVELRNPVVVLGYGLWQRLGADPSIVGKTVRMSGVPYTVVGVTAPGFLGTDRGLAPEFWAPLAMRRQLWPDILKHPEEKRTTHWIESTGRLRPGVSREQAVAALNVIAARIASEMGKKEKPAPMQLTPAGHFPDIGPLVAMLMSALGVVVALVLLIACANVANLLLARAETRRREIGIRLSLGAGRPRIVRQLLTESVLLASAGALFGFLLAVPGARALAAFQPPIPLPVRFDFSPDMRVLWFTTGLALLTGILFGLAPALTSTRVSLASTTRASGLGNGGTRGGRLGITLVGVQVTLSLVLLVASGLFLRNLQSAAAIDLGLRPDGVLMLSVDTVAQGYSPERTGAFFREAERRIQSIPGIQSVSFSNIIPLSMVSNTQRMSNAADKNVQPTDTNIFMVGARYFETMGIPIHAGRDFIPADRTAAVTLISKTMATRLFGRANPIGQHVRESKDDPSAKMYEVIGVVGDSKAISLGEAERACMFRYFPSDFGAAISLIGSTIVLRANTDPAALARPVRSAIEAVDPDMAIFGVETMTRHVDKALMLPRVCAVLFGAFGLIGLMLAAVGLYGVVNYSVRSRTREIGIRLALGAGPARVAAGMARQGLLIVCVGLAAGLGISFALSRYMSALLYGVTPTDPVTFIGVPIILIGVALLAIVIPASRAARLDPMSALRYE